MFSNEEILFNQPVMGDKRKKKKQSSSKKNSNNKKQRDLQENLSKPKSRNLSDSSTHSLSSLETSSSEINDKSMNSQAHDSFRHHETEERAKQGAIPAFKFTIKHSHVTKYSSPIELKAEILKHKQVNFDKIKFLDIKSNLIIIATDDKPTHDCLNSEWPANAFTGGIRIRSPGSSNSLNIVMVGVHTDIDPSNESINNCFKDYGLTQVSRPTKKNGQLSSILKAKAKSKKDFDFLIANKIIICHTRLTCLPDRPILQCFNCQRIGHSYANCSFSPRCLKCGKNHKSSDCNNASEPRCANCNGNHAAVSRSCFHLKEAARKVTIETKSKIYHNTDSHNKNSIENDNIPNYWATKTNVDTLTRNYIDEQISCIFKKLAQVLDKCFLAIALIQPTQYTNKQKEPSQFNAPTSSPTNPNNNSYQQLAYSNKPGTQYTPNLNAPENFLLTLVETFRAELNKASNLNVHLPNSVHQTYHNV